MNPRSLCRSALLRQWVDLSRFGGQGKLRLAKLATCLGAAGIVAIHCFNFRPACTKTMKNDEHENIRKLWSSGVCKLRSPCSAVWPHDSPCLIPRHLVICARGVTKSLYSSSLPFARNSKDEGHVFWASASDVLLAISKLRKAEGATIFEEWSGL